MSTEKHPASHRARLESSWEDAAVSIQPVYTHVQGVSDVNLVSLCREMGLENAAKRFERKNGHFPHEFKDSEYHRNKQLDKRLKGRNPSFFVELETEFIHAVIKHPGLDLYNKKDMREAKREVYLLLEPAIYWFTIERDMNMLLHTHLVLPVAEIGKLPSEVWTREVEGASGLRKLLKYLEKPADARAAYQLRDPKTKIFYTPDILGKLEALEEYLRAQLEGRVSHRRGVIGF